MSEFEAQVTTLDYGVKLAVEGWIATGNGQTIAEAIESGTAIAVSEGPFENNFGTAAFVVDGTDSNERVEAVMPHGVCLEWNRRLFTLFYSG